MVKYITLLVLAAFIFPAIVQAEELDSYRWQGHDFVFCFMTDDGRTPNFAWADTAKTMDFRFTMAVNISRNSAEDPNQMTLEEIHELAKNGFEIAGHGYSHGFLGLEESCPMPPRGSLMGYFLCEDLDPSAAMAALHVEIERDSIMDLCDLDEGSVKTLAYPRHRYGKALIDSLISEGYIAARTGGRGDYVINSYGDFQTPARNSWDDGISLYRVPTAIASKTLFGNHSADPAVHYTYEQFYIAAMNRINAIREDGGMFLLYTHHLGDDDDSYGDINYGSGGITKRDLAWIVDLVRKNGGVVMTFGEAADYYRSRATMVNLDGDYVWIPDVAAVDPLPDPTEQFLTAWPNPFNPRTEIYGRVSVDGHVELGVYDLRGARVATLTEGFEHAGIHRWMWDGANSVGETVPAGVYLARLKTAAGSVVTKLMLLK